MATKITERCDCGNSMTVETTQVADAVSIANLFQQLHTGHGGGAGEGSAADD